MNGSLPAPSFRARLANVVRQDRMRRAHAHARALVEASPLVTYGAALASGFAAEARRRPACDPRTVAAQAAEWAAHARRAGCRFDVEAKALDALRFSLASDARGLLIPTKLVGVAAAREAVLSLRDHLAAGGARALTLAPDADGIAVAFRGDSLGRLQPKHQRWAALLPPFRVAALCVTGGTDDRPSMGVNVAVEVWPHLPPPSGPRTGPGQAAADPDPGPSLAAAEAEADARHL